MVVGHGIGGRLRSNKHQIVAAVYLAISWRTIGFGSGAGSYDGVFMLGWSLSYGYFVLFLVCYCTAIVTVTAICLPKERFNE
jgi:hypothetical protein